MLEILEIGNGRSSLSPSLPPSFPPYLQARENGKIDLLLQVIRNLHPLLRHLPDPFSIKNHRPPRSSQRLVSRRRHDIRVRERRRNDTSGHQARNMRHVRKEVGVVLVRDLNEGGGEGGRERG